jgi:hypothetical protein
VQTDEPGQQPGPPEVDRQAALDEDLGEAGGLRRQDQITAQGEVGARSRRHPADLGDRRLAEAVQLQAHVVDRPHHRQLVPLAPVPRSAQIGAGAERPARSGDHHHPILVVRIDGPERVAQLGPHGGVDGVLAFRTVEGDRHHPGGPLDLQRLHGPAP